MSPGFGGNPLRQEPVDVEVLESVVGDYDVQISQDGFVDSGVFWEQLQVGKNREKIEELMEAGLADYFNFVYDEEFEMAPVGIDERVGKPEAYGFAALPVYESGLPDEAVNNVAGYALTLALEVQDDRRVPVPTGLMKAVGVLAENGVLQEKMLQEAVKLALTDKYFVSGLEAEDFRPVLRGLGSAQNINTDTVAFQLLKILEGSKKSSNSHLPSQIFNVIFESVQNEELLDRMIRFTLYPRDAPALALPPRSATKELGAYFLGRSDDSDDALTELAECAVGENRENFFAAVAEAIEEHSEKLDTEIIRQVFEDTVDHAPARSRRELYKAVYPVLGNDILEQARDDNAKSIRKWAEEQE